MASERLFAEERAQVEALADEIEARLKAAAEARGAASLIVTGGATPAPLYDVLNGRALPWRRLWVTLTDERWLPTNTDGSNERLVRERLLPGRDDARLIPLKTEDATPQIAAAKVDEALARFPRPVDVVVLGMGPDGHFASLFPGNAALATGLDPANERRVVAVDAPGAYGTPRRLSLTLPAVLDSRWIAILIRGEDKLALLRRAVGADPASLPIAAVLDQTQTPVSVFYSPQT